jgi:ribosomal protein S18 acetylase RimI-like enzyme
MPDEYLNGLKPEARAEMWRRGIEANWPGQRDVITVDGHVAGFAAYGAERDSDDPTRGELYAINVHPDYWRRGLGRQLIRHATGELSRLGFATAVLWVEASTDRARRFYKSRVGSSTAPNGPTPWKAPPSMRSASAASSATDLRPDPTLEAGVWGQIG